MPDVGMFRNSCCFLAIASFEKAYAVNPWKGLKATLLVNTFFEQH